MMRWSERGLRRPAERSKRVCSSQLMLHTVTNNMELAFNLLLKHYLFLSPATPALIPSPPFLTPAQISLPSSQAYIITHFLPKEGESVDEDEEAGAAGWRRVYWRRVVREMEAGLEQRRAETGSDLEDEVRRGTPKRAA